MPKFYQDIAKHLSQEDLEKYHAKLRYFKIFTPKYLALGNSWQVQYDLGKFSEEMSHDEFETYWEALDKKERIYIGQKGACSGRIGYMYDFKEDSCFDEMDKIFLERRSADQKWTFYALHTHGGYWGFFRPDIVEAIHLLHQRVSLADLESIERIYITTQAHPALDIDLCFDRQKDKHRAKTTCYVIYKEDVYQRCCKKRKDSYELKTEQSVEK